MIIRPQGQLQKRSLTAINFYTFGNIVVCDL